MAYATVVIKARLKDLNPQLEEAAQDLGARPLQVFFLITLPMIGQSLMSAWLLTFTLSLDDVVLAAFLSGPGSTTLPLVIFSRARLGVDPSVNAVATVVIAVVSVAVIGGSYALARAERRRALEMAQAAHGA
jgi:putrescine transport system permease protein